MLKRTLFALSVTAAFGVSALLLQLINTSPLHAQEAPQLQDTSASLKSSIMKVRVKKLMLGWSAKTGRTLIIPQRLQNLDALGEVTLVVPSGIGTPSAELPDSDYLRAASAASGMEIDELIDMVLKLKHHVLTNWDMSGEGTTHEVLPLQEALITLNDAQSARDFLESGRKRGVAKVVVELAHADANAVQRAIAPFVCRGGLVIPISTNKFFVADYATHVRRLLKLVEELDATPHVFTHTIAEGVDANSFTAMIQRLLLVEAARVEGTRKVLVTVPESRKDDLIATLEKIAAELR